MHEMSKNSLGIVSAKHRSCFVHGVLQTPKIHVFLKPVTKPSSFTETTDIEMQPDANLNDLFINISCVDQNNQRYGPKLSEALLGMPRVALEKSMCLSCSNPGPQPH